MVLLQGMNSPSLRVLEGAGSYNRVMTLLSPQCKPDL